MQPLKGKNKIIQSNRLFHAGLAVERMKVKVKIWLEEEGQIMGEGLYEILQAVERHGSINQAASELKMSYRQAWGRIKKVEQRLGIPILLTRVGGEFGGGAQLTKEGRELVKKFAALQKEIQQAADKAFKHYFKEQ